MEVYGFKLYVPHHFYSNLLRRGKSGKAGGLVTDAVHDYAS